MDKELEKRRQEFLEMIEREKHKHRTILAALEDEKLMSDVFESLEEERRGVKGVPLEEFIASLKVG